mmetsp:Transcript_29031/g.77548  ORF Transcript_29031/g.77548 Transcript_29031/m.77548 type:complete len:254 (-) Transcript_29031:167-928(-)
MVGPRPLPPEDLPEETLKSSANFRGKLFDTEAADYKTKHEHKVSNFSQFMEQAGDKVMDWGPWLRSVVRGRVADCRCLWTMVKEKVAAAKGMKFANFSPFKEFLNVEMTTNVNFVGKFFGTVAADYKNEYEHKVSNYNQLLEKAGDKFMDSGLAPRVVAMDGDADRRCCWTTAKEKVAVAKGERFANFSKYKDEDYNQCLEQAVDMVMDRGLVPRIVVMDRAADRRCFGSTVKEKVARPRARGSQNRRGARSG